MRVSGGTTGHPDSYPVGGSISYIVMGPKNESEEKRRARLRRGHLRAGVWPAESVGEEVGVSFGEF